MAGDGEFDFIRQHLRALTEGDPAARDLADDAALVTPNAGEGWVLACDTLVAGVHFRETDGPAVAAARALRTNLSDLAAMGATPRHYLAAMTFSRGTDPAWRSAFVTALQAEQARFGLTLIGGDTTVSPGPTTISLTLLGVVTGAAPALPRSGAQVGEDVWVSGVIGDGYLGLFAVEADDARLGACRTRYESPQPRLELGAALRGVASSALDVSDGLLADLGHLASASDVVIEINRDHVPVSAAGSDWLARGGDPLTLLGGGDDYELAFTAPASQRDRLVSLAETLGLALTRIGRVLSGKPAVVLRDGQGAVIPHDRGGFTHF